MRESSTYQAILAEGRAQGERAGRATEAREILLRLGRQRFGPPDRSTWAAVERLADLDRLERVTERLLEAGSWAELLATP